MRRAVFFDRDGILNEAVIDGDSHRAPHTMDEFLSVEGAKDAFDMVKRNGFLAIIVTNQPDVVRGKMEESVLAEINSKISDWLEPDDFFICPHDYHHGCDCKKPKPGMLLAAADKHDIDLKSSYIIGDTWKDMEAGRSCGCKTVLIRKSYNSNTKADFILPDLKSAVATIIGGQ